MATRAKHWLYFIKKYGWIISNYNEVGIPLNNNVIWLLYKAGTLASSRSHKICSTIPHELASWATYALTVLLSNMGVTAASNPAFLSLQRKEHSTREKSTSHHSFPCLHADLYSRNLVEGGRGQHSSTQPRWMLTEFLSREVLQPRDPRFGSGSTPFQWTKCSEPMRNASN